MKISISDLLTLVITASLAASSVQQGSPTSNLCGRAGDNTVGRVVGGTEADNCEFPWMVMVNNINAQTTCGGTIIDNTHILTAAHCFFPGLDKLTGEPIIAKAPDMIVFSGSSVMSFGTDNVNGIKSWSVSEIILHENYNHTSLEHDIAILKLAEPITFNQCHRPLCMVDGSKTPQQATNCRTMGWGYTSNEVNAEVQTQLQYVDVPVVPDNACRKVFGSLSSEKTFCAGADGKDSCQGDSGGPFTCRETDERYYIYGIVSAGIDQSCGKPFGLYTKVSTFLPWIKNNTS